MNKALSGVEKKLRGTQTSLRDVNRMLKLDPTNTELLQQKQKLLQQAIQGTEEKLKTLKTASEQAAKTAGNYNAWKAAYTPVQEEIEKTSDKIDKLKRNMKFMEESGQIDTEEYKHLQSEVDETTKKLNTLKIQRKQIDEEFGKPISPEAFDSLQREIIETEKELKALKKTTGSASDTFAKLSESTEKFGNNSKQIGKSLLPLTAAITGVGTASVVMANNFNDAMSQAAGALDKPMSEMKELRQLAIQTGQDTIFSATESANAITELAKGGLTEAEIKAGALQTTMDLAASSGMDLGSAANVVVQTMGAFGLSADKSATAANALAGAAAASSTDVEPLTQALAQCSAGAKNAGWEVQETTAVLGRFADAGITGSDAGTSLKTMLKSLAAPSNTAAKLINKLGIKTRDSSGNLLDASSMAEELKNKLGGLDSASRDAALSTIFGSDAMRAATVMMNSGSEGLKKYIDAANDQEAAQRLANAQMSDGSRAIEELKGSFETAAIQIGDTIAPVVQKVAECITKLVNKFTALPSGVQKIIIVIAAIVAAAGPILIIIGQMSLGISALTGAFSKVSGAGGIFKTFGGVIKTVISGIATAAKGLFSLLMANPIILVIAAIIGVVILLYTKCEWFRDGVNSMVEAVVGFFLKFGEKAKEQFEKVKMTIELALLVIITHFQNMHDKAKEIWEKIKAVVVGFAVNIALKATETFNNMVKKVKETFGKVPEEVRAGFAAAIAFITSLPAKALKWGADFIDGLAKGIRNTVGKVTDAVKGVANKITSFLHFSRPDEGPLHEYETWMPDFMDGLAKGIKANQFKVTDAVKSMAGKMAENTISMNSVVAAGAMPINLESNTVVQIGNEKLNNYIVKTATNGINKNRLNSKKMKGSK